MSKEHMLEYLYGEMDEQQRIDFERAMENNAALQKEVTELQMVRSFLDSSPDEEATPIKLVLNSTPSTRRLPKYWSVAAAILLLLIAGKILGLNIHLADKQMTISFNSTPGVEKPKEIPIEQYAELKQDLASIRAQLTAFQRESKTSGEPENQLVRSPAEMEQSQLVHFIENALEKQQSGLETRLTNRMLEEQQIYIQAVAQDLIRYWDEQRKNDLDVINDGLQNLAQSIQLNNDDFVQLVNNPRNNY